MTQLITSDQRGRAAAMELAGSSHGSEFENFAQHVQPASRRQGLRVHEATARSSRRLAQFSTLPAVDVENAAPLVAAPDPVPEDFSEIYARARGAQSAAIAGYVIASGRALRAVLNRVLLSWRRRRRVAATRHALFELDNHGLRDLGLSRSEIGSIASELSGDAGPTRWQVLQSAQISLMQRAVKPALASPNGTLL